MPSAQLQNTEAQAAGETARRAIRFLVIGWIALLVLVAYLRFGIVDGWPTAADVHRYHWSEWLAVAALALAAASMHRVVQRLERTRCAATALPLLIPGLLLGAVLGWHGYELHRLWSNNVIGRFSCHSSASLEYLKDVSARLTQLRQDQPPLDAERRALVGKLQEHLVGWTANAAADSSDIAWQRASLRTLAHDVYPRPANVPAVEQYLAKERSIVSHELELAAAEEISLKQRIENLSHRLSRLTDSKTAETLPSQQSQPAGVGVQDAIAQLAAELTDLESRLQIVRRQKQAGEARVALRQDLQPLPGLNAHYPWLRLPVVIPGGEYWSWAYLCTSIAFLTCGLVGLLMMGLWSTGRSIGISPRLRFLRALWILLAAAGASLCLLL